MLAPMGVRRTSVGILARQVAILAKRVEREVIPRLLAAVRIVAICHDTAFKHGTTLGPLRARPRDAISTCRRAVGTGPPTAAVGPSAATATCCYLREDAWSPCRVTGGHDPPSSPPVTRPGSGSPSAPRFPHATAAPQPGRRGEPFSPVPASGGKGPLIPLRSRPPRNRREAQKDHHAERIRVPLLRAPLPPESAREGRVESLRSRWSRSRRTCSWRSSSVVPPQTPCNWCVARAY